MLLRLLCLLVVSRFGKQFFGPDMCWLFNLIHKQYSSLKLSAESSKILRAEKFFHCLTLHFQNLPKLNSLFT